MNADTLTMPCREGDVEAKRQFSTSVYTFMRFSNCRLKFDVSACSLVQDRNPFIYERLLSTRVANVGLSLSQTYSGWWASFSA